MKLVLKWLFGLLFVVAGANHFRVPDLYVRIMPPYLPWPRELVYVSGVCEIALGGLLLVPACSRYAAWGLVALLIAVFPANLYMAMNPDRFADLIPGIRITPVELWARLPLQGVLIAWAYWFTSAGGRK